MNMNELRNEWVPVCPVCNRLPLFSNTDQTTQLRKRVAELEEENARLRCMSYQDQEFISSIVTVNPASDHYNEEAIQALQRLQDTYSLLIQLYFAIEPLIQIYSRSSNDTFQTIVKAYDELKPYLGTMPQLKTVFYGHYDVP